MQASSMPATPSITGAWNACPANPKPINPTRTITFPFYNGLIADGLMQDCLAQSQSKMQ
jgi:hypothetical protein